MPTKTTWIVVADAAHVRVLESSGIGKPVTRVHEADQSLTGAKQNADEPGRAFESADGSRHSMAPRTDLARMEKREVAADLAGWLDEEAKGGRFDRLVLAAAPQFLGDLRDALSDAVRSKVIAEVDKDYTKLTDAKIREHIADHAPV